MPDLSKPAAPYLVPRKSAASVVSINNARAAAENPDRSPDPTDPSANASGNRPAEFVLDCAADRVIFKVRRTRDARSTAKDFGVRTGFVVEKLCDRVDELEGQIRELKRAA